MDNEYGSADVYTLSKNIAHLVYPSSWSECFLTPDWGCEHFTSGHYTAGALDLGWPEGQHQHQPMSERPRG